MAPGQPTQLWGAGGQELWGLYPLCHTNAPAGANYPGCCNRVTPHGSSGAAWAAPGAGRAVLRWVPQPHVSAVTSPSLHMAPSRTDLGPSTVTPCQRGCVDSAPTGFVLSHVLWLQHVSWAGEQAGRWQQLLRDTGFGTSTVHSTCSRTRLREWPGQAVSPATCMTQLCDKGGHQHKPPRVTRGADEVVCPQDPVGCGADLHQQPIESWLQAAVSTDWPYNRLCPQRGHPALRLIISSECLFFWPLDQGPQEHRWGPAAPLNTKGVQQRPAEGFWL